MVYQRMVAAGVGPASLDELLAPGRPGASTPQPVAVDPVAAPRPQGNGAGSEVVDIRTLLYKGARARHRAQELREVAKRVSGDDLRAIVDEVCDLVVLALEPE